MENTVQNSTKTTRRLLASLTAGLALLAAAETAAAQEIPLTGPLAGAPAVRKQRLYRDGRFMIGASVAATLLDEYQQNFLVGGRLEYNIFDWLGIGAFGAYAFHNNVHLVGEIQSVNEARRVENEARQGQVDSEGNLLEPTLTSQLTDINISNNFGDQLGSIDWLIAPQLTLVPFRGKIAIFQSIYVDSELYFFGGPAIVGVSERSDCGGTGQPVCGSGPLQDAQGFYPNSWDPTAARTSSIAVAPQFGLGFTFFPLPYLGTGFEWRAVPFNRNVGGFDNHGGGPDGEFPDGEVNGADRDFKFNNMITINFNFYLPLDNKVSE